MKPQVMIAAIVGIIILVGGAFLFQSSNKDISLETANTVNQVPENNQNADNAVESVESIELEAVGNHTGTGTANRTYDEENFIHLVVAQIGPSADGKFYEGWLVKDGIPVSTGKMIAEGGDYSLLFQSDTDYSDHNLVVITEETEADGLDGKPEVHVLEGTFQ